MKENGDCMNFIILFFKGLVMGIFMLVPGISGGTIAILLNLYDKLLISLSDLFKNFKANFLFLFTVLLGGIFGIFISSFFLSFIVLNFYFEMIYIFLGIVIYYLFETFFKSGKRMITRNILLVILGVILGLSFNLIPSNIFQTSNWENEYIMPSVDMLIKIANFFNVSTDYLLGLSEKHTLNTDGLSDLQITHIQTIIDDILN